MGGKRKKTDPDDPAAAAPKKKVAAAKKAAAAPKATAKAAKAKAAKAKASAIGTRPLRDMPQFQIPSTAESTADLETAPRSPDGTDFADLFQSPVPAAVVDQMGQAGYLLPVCSQQSSPVKSSVFLRAGADVPCECWPNAGGSVSRAQDCADAQGS